LGTQYYGLYGRREMIKFSQTMLRKWWMILKFYRGNGALNRLKIHCVSLMSGRGTQITLCEGDETLLM